MVNHRTLKDIQRWSVGHIKNDFEVTSYTFVKLIVLIILYYDNKGQIYLFLIFYLLSHIPFSLPYLLFLTSDPLPLIFYPFSLIPHHFMHFPYSLSNIQYPTSHIPYIPYPISLIPFSFCLILYPPAHYPVSNMPILHISYPISHILYPISHIPYPFTDTHKTEQS